MSHKDSKDRPALVLFYLFQWILHYSFSIHKEEPHHKVSSVSFGTLLAMSVLGRIPTSNKPDLIVTTPLCWPYALQKQERGRKETTKIDYSIVWMNYSIL